MELTEPIQSINNQLIDLFGIDTVTGKPIYRVVWSEDQLEKRLTEHTDSGVKLLFPEFRLLPKYRQWIQEKWVLERLTIVPELNAHELLEKTSYEPLWVFENNRGEALPPTLWACKFCIDTMNAAMGKSSLAKYVDEEVKNPDIKEKRIDKYINELFGDESGLLGTTITGESIIVPHQKES